MVTFCLFQDGQTSLPDGRLRAVVRGGIGVLGPGREPSGTLLLDDLHPGESLLFRKFSFGVHLQQCKPCRRAKWIVQMYIIRHTCTYYNIIYVAAYIIHNNNNCNKNNNITVVNRGWNLITS